MDELVRSLVRMQTALESKGIESAVIGAIALAVWGEPRYTRDVDLKVQLSRGDAGRLLDAIPASCTPLGDAPQDLLERAGMIFVKDEADVRIDLLLADVEFDRQAIARAAPVDIAPGVKARVCTAEDLIIYKLISTREKDHVDVVSIVRRQGRTLDRKYVNGWLRQFELALDDSTLVSTFERLMERVR